MLDAKTYRFMDIKAGCELLCGKKEWEYEVSNIPWESVHCHVKMALKAMIFTAGDAKHIIEISESENQNVNPE